MRSRFGLVLLAATALVAPVMAQQGRPRAAVPPEVPRAPVTRRPLDAAPVVDRRPHVTGDRWFGHAAPDDDRYRQSAPFARGRFTRLGPTFPYLVQRTDVDARRVWLAGGFEFEVAAWEWPVTTGWCWSCGIPLVVYEDPDHTGWYLLLDPTTHEYVHALYLGN